MRNQHIPTTAALLPFTPPTILDVLVDAANRWAARESVKRSNEGKPDSLKEPLPPGPDDEPPADIPVFLVKPMTESEFDRLGYELFRHNLVPPSQDSYRALLIDELFEIYGDEKGEEYATLLDQHWQSEDVYASQMDEWHEQDRQRMFDESQGAEPRKPLPLPQRMLGIRQRNKALLLAEEIRGSSAKLRDMTVRMQTYAPIQRAGLARLVVQGWTGFMTEFVRVDGIIPDETYDALRAEIGKEAIAELETFVASMGSLSETEKGNSASPPLTEQASLSSPEPSGADSDGASMSVAASTDSSSSSGPIPGSGSETTTDASSSSTSVSAGDMESIADTPAEA